MGSLSHIDVQIVVRQNGAARRGDSNDPALEIHLINDLSNQPVEDTVATARTVMESSLFKAFGPGKDSLHSLIDSIAFDSTGWR